MDSLTFEDPKTQNNFFQFQISYFYKLNTKIKNFSTKESTTQKTTFDPETIKLTNKKYNIKTACVPEVIMFQ